MPKVSVIIPCYNLGRYLKDAIDSVAAQESGVEVIVIDDASTDETQEVCALPEYAGLVTVHRNPTNLHVSRSRNIGVTMARGEYILPLDADDMLLPGAIHTLSLALDNDRLLDIACGSMEVLEEDGRRWVSGWPPKDFSFEAQMTGKNQLPYASMYKRVVWDRVGGYRPGYESTEDALFWTQAIALSFRAKKVTEAPTLLYRMRGDSLSHEVDPITLRPWWQLAPRKPQWTPYTYEPVKVSIVIDATHAHPEDVLHTVDCVWSQTLCAWECIIAGGKHTVYPPFVMYDRIARGELVLRVPAGVHLQNTFIERAYNLYRDTGEKLCPRLSAESTELCEETEMACGTCGKRYGNVATAPRTFTNRNMGAAVEIPGVEEGRMPIEFIGEGAWTIRGPVTGTMYYFDTMSGHKVKNVWAVDAKELIARFDTIVREYKGDGVSD